MMTLLVEDLDKKLRTWLLDGSTSLLPGSPKWYSILESQRLKFLVLMMSIRSPFDPLRFGMGAS